MCYNINGSILPYTEKFKYIHVGHIINPAWLMTMTLWDKLDLYMQELTKLSAVSLLRRCFSYCHYIVFCIYICTSTVYRWIKVAQNLHCLKHIVRQFIDVIFGVGCFSSQIENCRLRTMTPSDKCYVNQDGVVRQGCVYTIMFHRLMLVYSFGALYAKVIIWWSKLSYPVTFLSVIFFSKAA